MWNGSRLPSLAALCALASAAAAQEVSFPQPRNDAGFLRIKRSFNATALMPLPGVDCNGAQNACALTSAIWHKDRYWLLGREGWCCGLTPAVSALTFIHEWDRDGTYIRTTLVPLPVDPLDESDRDSGAANSAPEVRDMATDEWRYDTVSGEWVATGGQAVFIGTEEGIYVTQLNTFGEWQLWDRIQTANGSKTIAGGDFANPIAGAGLDALKAYGHGMPNAEGEGYMGVAFDANGDGGSGSFWVGADDGSGTNGLLPLGDPRGFQDPADPSTQRTNYDGLYGTTRVWDGVSGGNAKPILEIDLHGNVLTTLHNGTLVTDPQDPLFGLATGGEWVAGGLELDPLTGNLWVQRNLNQEVFELDTTTGDATGFGQSLSFIFRTGGVTGIPNGAPDTDGGFLDLILFSSNSGDDFLNIHRGHMYSRFDGLTEPRLLASISPGPPRRRDTVLTYSPGDTIDLLIDETGQGSAAPGKRPEAGALPAVMLVDFNAAADTDATTDLTSVGLPGVLPELRVHTFLSDPDPFNPALAPTFVVPYLANFTMPTDSLVSLPVPARLLTGQKIRMQAVYFDSRSEYSSLGAMVTNEVWFEGVQQREVLVELVGDFSWTPHPDGFFRIHYLGGPAIESVTLDLSTSVSPFGQPAIFDPYAVGMLDFAGAGRAWDPVNQVLFEAGGCTGTYRQDSDLTTGLVYDGNQFDLYGPLRVLVGWTATLCDLYTNSLGYELRSGFTTTTLSTSYPRDLTFRFTDFDDAGDVFRFDFATSQGTPLAHVGLVVTVRQAGGNVYTGALLPDTDGGRAFIGW